MECTAKTTFLRNTLFYINKSNMLYWEISRIKQSQSRCTHIINKSVQTQTLKQIIYNGNGWKFAMPIVLAVSLGNISISAVTLMETTHSIALQPPIQMSVSACKYHRE